MSEVLASGSTFDEGRRRLNAFFSATTESEIINKGVTVNNILVNNSVSATTIFSGGTNLEDVIISLIPSGSTGDITRIGEGVNTFTGGTDNLPTINVTGLTVDNITVSGESSFNALSATTFYSGSTDLSLLFGSGGTDQLVKISSGDTVSGFLFDKISTGSGLIKTLSNSGSNEFITISSTAVEWSENVTGATPVLAVVGKGYTIEASGVTATLEMPDPISAIPPADGDLIGVTVDDVSTAVIVTEENGSNITSLVVNQSATFRYDISLNQWLIIASHLPVEAAAGTTFYVDGFAPSGGDGSLTLPFNSLVDGRDAVIGSGSATVPEFDGAIIKVVSGVFEYAASVNFFVEGITYEFSDGVTLEATTGSGYSFDNSSGVTTESTQSSEMNITGDLVWFTSNKSAGFINAQGTDRGGAGTGTSTDWRKITANFNTATSFYDNGGADPLGSAAIPVISTQCDGSGVNVNNAYRNCLEGTWNNVYANDTASAVVYFGEGSRIDVTGDIGRNYTVSVGQKPNQRVIKIENVGRVILNNCTINTVYTDNYIDIDGACSEITLDGCTGLVTGSANTTIKADHFTVVLSGYSADIRNSPSTDTKTGIFFDMLAITSSNFNGTPYAIKPQIVSTPIAVDFIDCSLPIDVSPDINFGYYTGNPSVQGTPEVTPARSNTVKDNITFYNIPIASAGLNSGAIWNDAGALKIV